MTTKKKKKSFVENVKQKKKIKAQKKLELIEEESGWDTFIEWSLTNWLTILIILGVAGYWGYLKVDDYLEERKIRIEAEAKLETILLRTEEAERQIEDFRDALEKARMENALLRREIEKLSPSEKREVILSDIERLKEKLQIVDEKSLKEKFEEKIYELTSQE